MKQWSTWNASQYVCMDCLYLTESRRGNGFGKLLLEEVKRYAVHENCKEIQWQTPGSNVEAIKFYQREGAVIKTKVRCFLDVNP